jgi:hypothetical protein
VGSATHGGHAIISDGYQTTDTIDIDNFPFAPPKELLMKNSKWTRTAEQDRFLLSSVDEYLSKYADDDEDHVGYVRNTLLPRWDHQFGRPQGLDNFPAVNLKCFTCFIIGNGTDFIHAALPKVLPKQTTSAKESTTGW